MKYKERIYMNLSGWLCCNILTCFLLFHFTAWREVPVRGKSTSSLTSINDTLHCVFLLFYSSLLQCTEVLSSNPQIRKLRRELDASQEKVSALTTQLTANVSTNSESKHWPGMHLMQQLPPIFFKWQKRFHVCNIQFCITDVFKEITACMCGMCPKIVSSALLNYLTPFFKNWVRILIWLCMYVCEPSSGPEKIMEDRVFYKQCLALTFG